MKINSILRITVLVPAVMASAVIVALVFSFQQTASIQKAGDNVRQIRSSITDLNHIVLNYILYHQPEPQVRFDTSYDHLVSLIDGANLKDAGQQALMDEIKQEIVTIDSEFSTLVVAGSVNNSASGPVDLLTTETALVNSILTTSHDADNTAAELRFLVDQGIRSTALRTTWLIVGAVLLAALVLTPFMLTTRRRIVSSLSKLMQGTAAVGAGNLDYEIELHGDDEFTELKRAFNGMTSHLKSVTASKASLEAEIAERKKAEEGLSQANQRIHALMECSPLGVIEFDSNFRVTRWSKESEQIFGWTAAEVLGKAISEIKWVYTEDVGQVDKVSSDLSRGWSGVSINRNYRKDGTVIWCEWYNSSISDTSGNLTSVLSLVLDITAKRKAEEALKESQLRWATTLSSIGDAVIATDTAGKITFINAVAENLTGWKLSEASGQPVESVFHIVNEYSRQIIDSPVAKVIRDGVIVGLANHTILIRKDGSEVPIDDSGAPIKYEDGRVKGAVLVFRDVTSRRQNEKALKALNEELEEKVRSRTKDVVAERQRLFSVLETLPAMICLLTPDYRVAFSNKAFRDMFGEARGRKCYDQCFGLQKACDFCESYEVLKTGKPRHWEVVEPGGRVIDVHDFPFTDADGTPMILEMDIDITAERLAEKRLRELNEVLETKVNERTVELSNSESQARRLAEEWQKTFDSISDMVSIQDKDSRLVKVNRAYLCAVGVPESELVGRKCHEIVHGLSCPIDGCPHQRTLETRESSINEFFEPHLGIYLEASTSPIVDKNGEVIGTVHIAKDITQRKLTENELQLERDKLMGLLNTMDDGVAIIGSNLDVDYVNPAMEKQYGPINGRKCFEYFNGRTDSCPWCRNDEVFQGKTIRTDVQSSQTGKTYEVTYAPLKNGDGTFSKLTVWHDITERKKVEELKDDFIGMVSHELRTPLTIITGAIHTAMLEGLPEDEQILLLKDAASGAESLSDILDNLLELSRYQAKRLVLHAEPVNVHRTVENVVEKLKTKSKTHQIFNDTPDKITVLADKVRIERILHNLIENAIKYSPAGGEVRISATRKNEHLTVGVSDQGIGISSADQLKLFQPFERLDMINEGIKGLGLGLVVCSRLVEAHKGKMWVDSSLGQGSTFYFSIPVESKNS